MFCSEDALVHLLTFCEFQYNGSFLFFFFEKINYLATVSVNDPSICSLPSLIAPPPPALQASLETLPCLHWAFPTPHCGEGGNGSQITLFVTIRHVASL